MTEFCLICALVICCQGAQGHLPHQKPAAKPVRMVASWYGSEFHGKKMKNGEKFNKDWPIAAHRTLPIGTVLELTLAEDKASHKNKEEKTTRKKKVIRVVVKDRGPHKKNRDLDVSEGVAKQLGFVKEGHAILLARVIKYGPDK